MRALTCLVAALLLAGGAAGQATDEEILDQFIEKLQEHTAAGGSIEELVDQVVADQDRLAVFNACSPVVFGVEDLDADAKEMGLAKEDILPAAESRLRAARLYAEGFADMYRASGAHLVADVQVVGLAFKASLTYRKQVTDEFGTTGIANTWSITSTGTHGGNQHYIAAAFPPLLDEFLADYLRVNAEACGGGPTPPAPDDP